MEMHLQPRSGALSQPRASPWVGSDSEKKAPKGIARTPFGAWVLVGRRTQGDALGWLSAAASRLVTTKRKRGDDLVWVPGA